MRAWCGYADPRTSRIVTKSAAHETFGFHDARPLVAADGVLPSVGETTARYTGTARMSKRSVTENVNNADFRAVDPPWLGARLAVTVGPLRPQNIWRTFTPA